MPERVVDWSIEGATGTITVRRPKALNALNAQVIRELDEAFAHLVDDAAVRVILLTGEGDRAFIAGADIGEFVGATPTDAVDLSLRIRRVTDRMVASPKPVVAVVNGFALGGGFEMALACDIRIAATTALFGLPEIKLGILPGGGGTVRLTQVAGTSVARQIALIGESIPAERARELGIVASVHEPAELAGAAKALAAKLAAYSAHALAQLKATLNTAVDAPTSAALDHEARAFALCFTHPDQLEGAKAFLEKRKPSFA